MKNLLFLLLIFSVTEIFSQGTATIHMDQYGFPVEQRENAAYYLVVSADTLPGLYRVNEFYMSDTLKQTGTYLDPDLFIRQGIFITYHPNGMIKSERNFEMNGEKGIAKYWYANGQLKEIRTHDGKNIMVQTFCDSLGRLMVKNGAGTYTLKEEEVGYSNKHITLVGPVRNGYKNGLFTGYLSDGTTYCKEEYINDQLVQGISYHDGKEFPYNSLTDPAFYQRLMNHIGKTMRYPASARRNGVDGTVYLRMLLNKDYSVKKVYLMKTVSKDIDAEAIRVVKDSGFKFGPIIKRGQLHEYIVYVLPLKFKLG